MELLPDWNIVWTSVASARSKESHPGNDTNSAAVSMLSRMRLSKLPTMEWESAELPFTAQTTLV